MSVYVKGALQYAVRTMHEDPDDPRIVENQFEWVNTAKNFIVEHSQWQWLEAWGSITIPNSGIVYFPDYVWEIYSIYPSAFAYRRPTSFIGARQFDDAGPATTAGLSDYTIRWGFYGCHADVGTTGQISVESSAGFGDQGVQVFLEGLADDDLRSRQYETLTLNAAGQATSTLNFRAEPDGLRRVYVGFDSLFNPTTGLPKSRGILTVTDSGSKSLERLDLSREIKHEHIRAEFYPASGGPSFVYRYWRREPDIISLDYVFEIPSEYQDAYHYALKAQIAEYQAGPGAGDNYWGMADRKLNSLKWRQERQPGRRRGLTPHRGYRNPGWRL